MKKMEKILNNNEGETMKKPIEQILPNPHRDFDIYPIGDVQVEVLLESINDVGMFLGLPARKVGGGYEIAAGHHRLEALKRSGAERVDLAVKDYTDTEMLKIMIRENSSQRGNENFGAVMDNVAAVLVECVRDYGNKNYHNIQGSTLLQKLQNGDGIGHKTIHKREPALSTAQIQAALRTFKATGIYLQLLKKGGLPEEFWHLYEKPQTTTIQAVSMFPKAAHAATWISRVDDEIFQSKIAMEQHINIVGTMTKGDHPLSTGFIEATIIRLKDTNLGSLSPIQKEEKTLEEKAADVITAIKALNNKMKRFKEEKGDSECFIKSVPAIIADTHNLLDWFNNVSQEEIINV